MPACGRGRKADRLPIVPPTDRHTTRSADDAWPSQSATRVLHLVGRRWVVRTLRALRANGPLGHAELLRATGDVSKKVLTEHLRELEAWGFLERSVVLARPRRTSYALTAKGRLLLRHLDRFLAGIGRILGEHAA